MQLEPNEYFENATKEQRASANLSSEISLADQNHFIGQNKDQYQSLLNAVDPQTCKTVVVHVCEKPNEDVHLPNPAYTYQKMVKEFAPREVLLLPEYNSNLNWKDTLHWISTDFTGIPICLPVFEGGNLSLPDPNLKLTLPEVQQAMSVADVRMIRIAEMISWYMEYSNPASIRDEVIEILDICQNNGLKVLW